nr:9079_t:CDS:10 [Entrophospora candida]
MEPISTTICVISFLFGAGYITKKVTDSVNKGHKNKKRKIELKGKTIEQAREDNKKAQEEKKEARDALEEQERKNRELQKEIEQAKKKAKDTMVTLEEQLTNGQKASQNYSDILKGIEDRINKNNSIISDIGKNIDDKNYPQGECIKYGLKLTTRSQVYEIYLNEPIDENKITFKNLPKEAKINLINAQRHINYHYPTKETREQVTKLDISGKKLEGHLDLSDFINLEELNCFENKLTSLNLSNCQKLENLYCSRNQLTSLDVSNCANSIKLNCSNNNLTKLILPTNPTNLKELYLSNNNLPEQDLSFLKFISKMSKLEFLNISYTDINEVNIDKLPKSLARIEYSTDLRPDCKLTKIVPLLNKYFDLTQLSGQELIEKFIQQQAAGGFSKIYKANCKEIKKYDEYTESEEVVLKILNNSKEITHEFLTEITNTNLVGGLVVNCCDSIPLPQKIKDEKENNTPISQQFKVIEKEYNDFSLNTPYKIHANAITTSKPINTRLITELLSSKMSSLDLSKTILNYHSTELDFDITTSISTTELTKRLRSMSMEEAHKKEPKTVKLDRIEGKELFSEPMLIDYKWTDINIGLKATDYNLATWLRDIKQLTTEQVLKHYNLEQLKQEYQNYLNNQLQTNIEQLPK